MAIYPYINFNGNCAEAFAFYEQLMDGTIDMLMRFSDSPEDTPVPDDAKQKVMHGEISIGDAIIMGTDAVMMPYAPPQGITCSLQLDDVVEAKRIFAGLAEGGTVSMALEESFFAQCFGVVTDRFGVPWQVMVAAEED